MSERRFDDRVAVITGAGRGLGRAYALLLASLGARVVVNDPGVSVHGDSPVDAGPAQQLVNEISAAGGTAIANTDTVATEAGGQAIIEAAMDHYGAFDVLIHNAGNVRYGSLEEISHQDFMAVLNVHLLGAFNVVRPAFPRMAAANYGRIVLTSSIGGLYGTQQVANYGTAKAGTIGLNNVIALEGADKGIKSNIILPGAVTRMAEGLDISQYPPMGPELVAPVVGYLAHESCAVTGELYIAMAGRVARAFIAETAGVYRPHWTIDSIAEQLDAIRDEGKLWHLPPVPNGYRDHLGRSFAMAKRGAEPKES
ncbi:SDR family NAD(P)-dependent oxidoreductase [Halioxenophilus sp. WMMB6]|uniref:SDR family NAD(P)-dependent oxidoreductase n=1 Tax=Halioxenophilus sp. WMMB6 TaxID=3073815 RepID=UPI00295E3FA1|nr:SDR family NAD(P)-dependent oxidoreductase [Halioxenophilus sp. WMMB6]